MTIHAETHRDPHERVLGRFGRAGDGAVARLDNFARFEIWESRRHRVRRSRRGIDKGQKGELDLAFIRSLGEGE